MRKQFRHRATLATQVKWRLVIALAITALASLGASAWVYREAYVAATERQLQDAMQHFAARARQLDERWEVGAFNFKARLEHGRLLEDAQERKGRLASYLAAQGGNPEFTRMVVADARGTALIRYPESERSGFSAGPGPDAFRSWYYSDTERTLYRVFCQKVWLGREGNGRFYLLLPLDNALLHNNVYPQAEASLLWGEHVVASSRGSAGIEAEETYLHSERGAGTSGMLPWDASAPGGPRLLIRRDPPRSLSWQRSVFPVMFGSITIAILGWVALAGWLRLTGGRIASLGRAAQEFTRLKLPSPAVMQALNRARGGVEDEIASLAASVDTLMHEVSEEQRQLDAAFASLQVSEKRFRDLAGLSSDWFWEQDADLRFTLMSVELDTRTGLLSTGTLGKQRWELPIEGVSEAQWAEHRRLLSERKPFEMSYQMRNDAGALRWFHIKGIPVFGPDGSFRGYRGTGSDFTARRQAEDEIRKLNEELEDRVRARTAELEGANRELEAFSYSLSHDLRSPLRAVKGYSHLLATGYAHRLDETGMGYVDKVDLACQRMHDLIDAMLLLSQVTRAEIHPQEVDLGELARAALSHLRELEPQRRADVVIAPGLKALADPKLARVLLDNLLGNAWKYTSRREAARIEFLAETLNGERVFAIRDNGAGFDMKYAAKLFSPFQRMHRIDEFDGAGIGLATVSRIVQRHGGRIWAEAVRDQGATFRFTLGA